MHKVVEKSWGSEKWIVNKDYCGKLMVVNPQQWCSRHAHQDKAESFFCVKGVLHVQYCEGCTTKEEFDAKCRTILLEEGDSFDIERGVYHRFTAVGNSAVFIEFSTHHEDSDTYRL